MLFLQALIDKVSVFLDDFSIAPTYIQAGSIVVLLFLLIIALSQFRHHFVKWSLKGGLTGLLFGFIFTVLIEGLLIINGETFLTKVFGWQNPPKPFKTALELGKEKLTNVLGANSEVKNAKDIIAILQSMNPQEVAKVKTIICAP